MNRLAVFFLIGLSPILAMLLALLGYQTIPSVPLGWFLLLFGASYLSGVAIVFFVRKQRFWESAVVGSITSEERGDLSFWLISLGLGLVLFLSPLDYLYFAPILPRSAWLAFGGLLPAAAGLVLLVWARRTLRKSYSGHLTVKSGQPLVQNGPYRAIRHPAYAGYFLVALGIALGYSSLFALLASAFLLLPILIYRIHVEEKLMAWHFGEEYRRYQQQTKRLIPGLW